MSLFKRILQSPRTKGALTDQTLSEPIKAAEAGLFELKQGLGQAMTGLSQVKTLAMRTRKEADNNLKLAEDCERRAVMYLTRYKNGQLSLDEADKLAGEVLENKVRYDSEWRKMSEEAGRQEKLAADLEAKVNKIKSIIKQTESSLLTLKARARTAAAARKIAEGLAKVDPAATVNLLEEMKKKVEEEEDLAEAYRQLGPAEQRLDQEIKEALAGDTAQDAQARLIELKKEMGLIEG